MIRIGTSGWSYPSWRPGFYPDGMQPAEFLRFYAERFDTVELNSTGYRLPSADQFRKWAEAVPDGFEFSTPDGVKLAWDFRDESWFSVDSVVRVNDPNAEPFRYLRLREPPYSDDDLLAFAATVRDPAYIYVRHEDEPTAPEAANRLRHLLKS